MMRQILSLKLHLMMILMHKYRLHVALILQKCQPVRVGSFKRVFLEDPK